MPNTELNSLENRRQDLKNILGGLYEELPLTTDPELKATLRVKIGQYERSLANIERQIKRASGLDTFEEGGMLFDRAKLLSIRKRLPELYLVNCDRSEVVFDFWDSFEDHRERHNPYQFYFLLACPTQQPDSFGERMVYELRKEELKDRPEAVLFKRRSDGKRVAFDELPQGRNLMKAQNAFKTYFSERFGLHQSNTSFEDYLNTGLPTLGFEYITLTFEIQAGDWNPRMMKDYLRWLVDTFADAHDQVPTFWFMFVIFIKNVHKEGLSKRYQKVVNDVKSIVESTPEKSTLLTPLEPVELEFLEEWLLKVDEENSASKIEDLIKTFIDCLPEDKKQEARNNELLDMTDIQRLQQIIYQISHTKE